MGFCWERYYFAGIWRVAGGEEEVLSGVIVFGFHKNFLSSYKISPPINIKFPFPPIQTDLMTITKQLFLLMQDVSLDIVEYRIDQLRTIKRREMKRQRAIIMQREMNKRKGAGSGKKFLKKISRGVRFFLEVLGSFRR